MFLRIQSYHQGGVYKNVYVQQIVIDVRV